MGFKMSSLYLTLVFVMWAFAATATATTTVVVSTAAVSTDSTASTTTITTDSTASTAAVSTGSTASTAPVTTDSTASAVAVTTDSTASDITVTTGSTASPVAVTTDSTASPVAVTTDSTASTAAVTTSSTASTVTLTTGSTASTAAVTIDSTASPVAVTTDSTASTATLTTDSTASTATVTTDSTASTATLTTGSTATSPATTATAATATDAQSTAAPTTPMITTTPAEVEMPSGLRLVFRETDRLGVEWTGSADSYRVTYQASGDTEVDSVASVHNTTHTIGNLTAGTSYAVRVYSIDGGRESAPLEGHWGTRPEAPTSLQLMTVNTDSLRATWNASNSADFYRVTYQASGGPEIQSVASVAGATHTIRNLSPGTLYTVRVYGIKNLVEGEPLLGDMRTEPEPPTNLQFTTVGIFRSSLLWVSWTASSSADTYRVSLEATGGPEVTYSVLADTEYTAVGLSPGTLYTIRVYSRKNDTEGALPLEGQQRTKPEAPTNLQFITVNTRSIEVSWNVSSSADTYRVTYQPSGGAETLSINSTSNTTHIVESLSPGTMYTVRVYGIKEGSESTWLGGDQGTRPESPTNLQFITVDSDTIEVTWNASSSAEAYRVTYQTPGGSQNVDVDSTSNTTHTIEGLMEVTSYTVRVYGIANGVESVPLLGMERTLPEAPTNLQFVNVTTDSIEVTWMGAADEYTVTAEGTGNVSSVSTSSTTHTFGGLSPGILYTITVTGIKNGSLGNPIDGVQGTKPEAPTYRDVFARTTDSLGVQWNASSSADAYRVTYQVSGGAETDSDASTPNTMHTIGGLSAGNLYTVRVYSIKHGAESEPLQLVLRTNPEAPTNLQFITVGTDSLEVSWTASSSADTYRVTYVNQTSGVDEVVSINSTPNTTHTIEGLSPGTLYTVRVYGFKNGLESLALRRDQGTRPESPTNLRLVEDGIDGIRVSWNASGSVDNYNVTYQTPGGVESADVVSGDRTTHLIAGLPSGTLYTIKVYGMKNDVASLPIQGDQRTIVASPRDINIPPSEVTQNSISVTWAPADGAKDSYNISISPPDGGNFFGSVDDGDPLEYTFTDLTAGTLYTISVTTISGTKGRTARRNQRTDTAPARNVSIIEATENNINITWAAAAGAKDNYSISIFPSDGDNPTGTVDEEDPLEYNFTGLTPGTLYTISVRAVSGWVYSVARTEIGRTKPNSPGDITTDIVSASIATWEPSTGGVFSGYEIIYTTDDGSPHHTMTVNNGTTTAPSPVALTIGTLYTLEMYAFSDDGGYRTESERRLITVGINTTAPTTLLQTCSPSFQQFSVREETANAGTVNVIIPDSTSCHNCSIVYGDATCFIDDVYNVSSYVVANSSSSSSCNLFITSPIDRETISSIRFDVSWARSVYNNGYNVHEDCGRIPVEIMVVDVNDNPPVFAADLKTTLYIRDQTPVDTILAVASAQDADAGPNADVTYSIPSFTESEYFAIDSDGVVTTRRELTQNLLSQSGLLLDEEVEVVVMATDGVHNITTTLSFRFLDTGGVNATASTLAVSIPEEEPAGTTVINLRDQRPFDDDNIIYSFTHTSKSFELNSTSGEVITAEVLDREQEDVYELTISASDPSGCYASASIEITVRVQDVNDHAPVFLETAYSGRIQEDSVRGHPVAIDGPGISAVDDDLGENSRITYTIDCCQDVFVIDNITGEITTMENDSFSLDREDTSVYHLTVVARDNPSDESLRMESRTTVTISVLDINDNRPTFIGASPLEMFLFENETVDTVVASVEAVDPDEGTNGNVFYEIRSGAEGRFTVNPRTGEVKIAGKLDRETKDFYQMEIFASDGGNTPEVSNGFYLNIRVEDVNDNVPTFTTPAYLLTVQEETETGTIVGNITAEDIDIGPNAQIKYMFTEAVQHFAIDETTGTLTVLSILDFDNATYPKISRFKVQASDGTFSSTVDVQVSLVDINDNAPSYRVDRYEVTLLFVAFPAIVTAVDATDKDSGTNAEISYNFTDERSGLFVINPFNGIIRLVGSPGSTDVTYNITVAATDSGYPPLNSTISLTIDISSLADASSTRVSFDGREFVGYVVENDNNEQVVTQLDATVIYSGTTPAPGACPLKYKMAASSDDFEFAVNETTGEIRTRGTGFDREIKASYTFAVVVEITCPDLIFDYTSVLVHVNDTNDESPTFESSSYSFKASEDSAGIEVGRVLAVDRDTGSNANFSYTIYPSVSPFRIDTSGSITVLASLDRELVDTYTLTILAEDMGVPSLNGTCTVHVRVLDINDNAPTFADSAYRTDLPEDANKAQLNITVSASDDDAGTNAEIGFVLQGEGSNLFSIDDVSGVVTLTGRLDYEKKSNYDLTITAMDNGHPSRTDSVRLTIEVTDVNDNAPIFDRDDYNSSTHRGVPTTEVLVTVSANDRDSGVNAQIMYSITGQYGIKPIRATIGETLFNINSSTGEIGVTTHFLYDDTQQYELIVTATDMGEPPLSNTTTVVIDVANTNFFAPEFLNTPVYRTMDEDTGTVWNSRPREVAKIKATDNDTEAEGQVIFLLPSNDNISDLFRVTTTKEVSDVNQDIFVGRIVTNAPLDREAHLSGLNLTVLAVDQGATPKTSTALIHITLNDVNDNPPTLIVPSELVPIPQSSQVGTPVFKVQVDDPDIVNEFSFETIPSNHEYFSIIETTGLIFTIKDFPEQREHTLFIIVNDGSGKTDYGAISIFVGNPNLHAPVFSQLLYRTTVQQDLQVGTNLTDLNIFACDMDCPDSCNVSLSANCTTNEGRLTYGIATGNARDIFVIDPHTGLISTKWPLESLSLIPNYILVVIATDQSENSRTGSATVWVDVVHLGTTSVAPTAFPSDTKKLETDLDNHRYALFGVSGFAGLLLMITLGLLVKLVSANRRVKQMSTAHLTTPAFTAPQYDYVPGMTDYAYAEGTGTDDDSPAPPPVANRPPLTLNSEERRAQATDRSHNVAMEMRSRMRPELQRQNRIEGRTADDRSRNSIYREQKYGYLQLNTRDTSNAASPMAETAVADKYGYLKPVDQARQNNQRGQPNNPYKNDKINRQNQVYTKDIPAPDYDVLPAETRI